MANTYHTKRVFRTEYLTYSHLLYVYVTIKCYHTFFFALILIWFHLYIWIDIDRTGFVEQTQNVIRERCCVAQIRHFIDDYSFNDRLLRDNWFSHQWSLNNLMNWVFSFVSAIKHSDGLVLEQYNLVFSKFVLWYTISTICFTDFNLSKPNHAVY